MAGLPEAMALEEQRVPWRAVKRASFPANWSVPILNLRNHGGADSCEHERASAQRRPGCGFICGRKPTAARAMRLAQVS
jgi:hypothetical protein